MNKKHIFLMSAATGLLAIGALAALATMKGRTQKIIPTQGTEPEYVLALDSGDTPAALTSSWQNNVKGRVTNASGYEMDFDFINAKTSAGNFVELAPRGMINNFGTDNEAVTGIKGIKYKGTGVLYARVAKVGQAGGAVMNDYVLLTSETKSTFPTSNYFQLMAGEGGAVIESLEITYSCDATKYDIAHLSGTYTGMGNDGSTYQLDVESNGDVVVKSLDKKVNIQLTGTSEMLSATQAKCTFVYQAHNIYYTMNVSADKHTLTYVSKTDDVGGAAAALVAELTLNRVYNVENFESYTKTGQGYTDSTKKYQTSGLRANYYADYWKDGDYTGEIGGSKWPVMTSTDNSNYTSNKGREGTKGGIFKFSSGMSMRYISMNELYGVREVIGKGSVLSFWARGAYSKSDYSANHGSNIAMKMYAYFNTPLTPSTQQTYRESFDFTVEAGTEWQHFEMPLTADRNYYGFGFFSSQSTGTTAYVPFDDIQIYTASPYAKYVAPVAATGVEVSPETQTIQVAQRLQLTAAVEPNDAANKAVAWSTSSSAIATVDSDGVVTGVAAGTARITATTDDGGFTDYCDVTVQAVEEYPSGTFVGSLEVFISDENPANGNYPILFSIGNAANGLVAVRISNNYDAEPQTISYNSSTKVLTITTTGEFQTLTYGTITAVYDAENNQLKNFTMDGTIAPIVANLNTLTADLNPYFFNCDGTEADLQAAFKRRVGTSEKGLVTVDNEHYVSGYSAVKLPGNSGGDVRLNLRNDLDTTSDIKNIGFWVYNPTNTTVSLRLFVYKQAGLGGHDQLNNPDLTINNNGWTYVSMGIWDGPFKVYNIQISDFTNSGVNLTFDNISLFA